MRTSLIQIHFLSQISWLLIIYAQNAYYFYTARIIAGIVGSGQLVCITIFVTEISHDKWGLISSLILSTMIVLIGFNSRIRGSLNSLFDPAYNIGTLLGFVLANHFDYVSQAKCHLILPIIYEILFARIPQSPQHLVNIQKQEVSCSFYWHSNWMNHFMLSQAAEKSYKFFKGTDFEKIPLDEKAKAAHDSELTLNDFGEWTSWLCACHFSC